MTARLRRAERTVTGRPPAAKAKGGPAPASDLAGQVVGLVGWGHTARHFAALLAPFGCEVLVASEHPTDDELAAVGARRASVGETMGAAKVVSLHRGLNDRTRGAIGQDQLALLRPGSVLVNAARGELVDEVALLRRLAKGDVVAALDVFAEEPLAKDHPLRALDNVILTPHNASQTDAEELRMGGQALRLVADWVDGREVPGITPDRLARMT